ncbi:RraA family protein [Yersinia kristensenii]|uniref:Putative 4-hydroxy-4-methyl-2-oxoglutarate aldolase n=1 Tax=Yersinia kristensenii TaxID=28152 RepID=A0A0T9L2U1_YERKR|nr:RraA family protein [Yersinia kristensenii]MBW5813422.1 RraA family protein [Yersinia kristensenii]MBW5817236.1 RraA family protein [Yersinia kristensenii]MBW5825825.1 RraA family protein [Yersinia kristensenii]MBW5830723.1 RraA family protein [Yersinia kristensenii]MBW5842704.1 RraA family protein [Yersinia kristensenii]
MKNYWPNDEVLFSQTREKLFVALVGDILDTMGLKHQFLHQQLKPVETGMVILGRAMPVLEADYFHESYEGNNPLSSKPFGLMFHALDDLKKNEVYICSGGSHRYAQFGGLMATRAIACGAAGAVVHGFHRDTNEILNLNFPVASFGSYAQDQGPRGKVVDWRVPIELDGIKVMPGDVIYGDRDGILVIPAEAVEEAFQGAFEKAKGENKVLVALKNGMTTVDAYEKFGIM